MSIETLSNKHSILIGRANPSASILRATGTASLSIAAGTVIEIEGRTHAFEAETPVAIGDLTAGRDYAIGIDGDGKPFTNIAAANPLDGDWFAGFHFAPGGNATARSGGSNTPAINPYSFWDIGFRPSCPDPRGMTLIETASGKRVWIDIYLLNVDHAPLGTSRHGIEIADGRSLDLLDFATAKAILEGHGKRLPTYEEFYTAAYGVTERSSADRDPKSTGLDAARTSRFGLMQATGNLWVWGTDGDPDDPRPSIFGGSWLLGEDAGSRYADLVNWDGHSFESLSARGACDHL